MGVSSPDDALFDELCSVPLAVQWTMNPMGEITYVSASVEQLRGITPEQAKTQQVHEIHPPDSMRASLAYFEQFSIDVLAGRQPQAFHDRLDYYCADGTTVSCEVVAIPILDEDGRVLELRGVSAPVMG